MRISDWSSDVCSSDLAPSERGENELDADVAAAAEGVSQRQEGRGRHRVTGVVSEPGDVNPEEPRHDGEQYQDADGYEAEARQRAGGQIEAVKRPAQGCHASPREMRNEGKAAGRLRAGRQTRTGLLRLVGVDDRLAEIGRAHV